MASLAVGILVLIYSISISETSKKNLPIAETDAATGEATHSSMVTRNNQGRIIICKISVKIFSASGPGSYTYGSRACRTTGNTAIHRRYAQRNREHLNQYARERYLSKWGKSNKEIDLKAEKFAFSKLLPSLGFTEIYDVTEIRRFVPFDFIASDQGSRVLMISERLGRNAVTTGGLRRDSRVHCG